MKSLLYRLSPEQWDAWYSQGRAIDRLVTDAEVDRFLQHVNPHAGASVLDVGCGIGSFSRQLSRWGYDVLGLDFSPIAIRTAHRQGVNGRLRYGVHDFDAGHRAVPVQPAPPDLVTVRRHQRPLVSPAFPYLKSSQ
ncbi:class I SAM-dependent methyltransferase [Streptomyces sp. NPDC056468]|uniref:class I SAM-dependent methyltransferase n=1 Tax=Streptomyces sp. NPDC056468 TaxID=3345830 RepID=UPI00367ACA82